MNPTTEGPMPTAAEAAGLPEVRDSREKVLDAFNSAFGAFENYPVDKLTPEQQSARDLIKSVKERTLDKNKVSYRNRFTGEDGKEYSQQEYMPVDELIIWLRERVKSGELSPEDEAKYREQERVLHGNAQEYYHGRNKKENSRKMARIRQEAQRIAADPRLATGNDHDNWLKANDILLQRRELIVPHKKDIVEPPPPPPPPPPPEEIKREVAFVNRTLDVRKRAGEVAEELLRKEMRRGSILNPLNWGRKIGLRVMEEYWRQKLTQQVYTSMLTNNNSYLNLDMARSQIGFTDVFRKQAGNLTMQTQADIGEEREAGLAVAEKVKLTGNELKGQKVVEAQGVLKDTILNQIIRPAVEGGITDYAEIQQKLREFVQNNQNDPQIQAVFGRDATQYGKMAEYFASDILETAEVIRQDIAAHKYAIEQLDKVVTVKLANTSWAAETQAQFNRADKAVAWAERHRISGLIGNPAFIGAAFSIGMYGSMRLLGIGGRAAQIAVPGAGLLPGALLAAARRNYDLKVDMASHQAERAYNMPIGQGSPRREALERFAYNTASVDDLINGGGVELVGGQNRESMDYLSRQDLSQEPNRQALVRRITEINKRLDFSAVNKVDLITFIGRGQVEQGRLALVRAVAQARVAFRNAGVTEDVIRADETRFAGEWEGRFTQNRQQQDRSFRWYRVRNAAGAGAFGAVAGLAGGFVTHEVLAGIGGFFEAPKPPVAPPSVPDINTIKSMFPGINAVVDPNGHINVTGAIPPDAQAEMQRLGFTVNHGPDIPGVSHTDIEHRPVFGPDGEWTKHATNVDHRELFRADQLKFHDFKDGNAVILDMSKIDGMWTTHNGVAGVFVTTPDAPQDGFFIPDSADGVIDHQIRLDPDDVTHMIQTPNGQISNSELAKMLINQDELQKYGDGSLATELNQRFNVFNIGKDQKFGFIEAGRMQARPEGNVLQVFATIRGLGPAPETIGVPIEVPGEPTPTFDITPPPVPEVVPEPETEETPFIIPIPFAPRHPLEPLRKPGEPDRPARGPDQIETLQELIQIRPEDLAAITPEQLQETEVWARNWTTGFVQLETAETPEERKRILGTWTARAIKDRKLINDRYSGSLLPLASTGQEGVDWKKQTNPGMLTCQLTSAGNALRSLGVYNDSLHSEQAMLNTLGGQNYADSHPRGASTYDLEDQVLAITPGIRFRGSNSVYEILEAIEKGAAVIIPLDPTHVGTILPGQRITRSTTGELQVQVVDPFGGVRLIPVENLIKSDIVLSWDPRYSMGIIIEKATPASAENLEAAIPTDVAQRRIENIRQQAEARGIRLNEDFIRDLVTEEDAIYRRYGRVLPSIDPIGYVRKQSNPYGMNTCVFASVDNVARAILGTSYDPVKYSEKSLVDALGGQEYARQSLGGLRIPDDIARLENQLRGDFTVRRTNSLNEILQAVERGAGVILPIWEAGGHGEVGHFGAILPGHRLRREDGVLAVQVINPLSGAAEFKTIEDLNRFYGIRVDRPDYYKVLIIEKRGRGPIRMPRFNIPEIRIPGRSRPTVSGPVRGTPETETLEARVGVSEVEPSTLLFGKESLPSINHPERNEDSYFVDENLRAAGVFDGMGGVAGGEIASQNAMREVQNILNTLSPVDSPETIERKIRQALVSANRIVKDTAPRDAGTTGSVVKVWVGAGVERKIIVGNIGDSRIWLLKKNGTLLTVTDDDGVLKADFQSGKVTTDQYKSFSEEFDNIKNINLMSMEAQTYFRRRNELDRFLGMDDFVCDTKIVDVDPGDLVLLTSDGVHDNLTNSEVFDILRQSQDPQEIARLLTQRSQSISKGEEAGNGRAKADDITAIVIKVPEIQSPVLQTPQPDITAEALQPPPRPVRPGIRERLGNIVQGLRPANQPQQPTSEERLEQVRRNRQAVIDAAIKKLAADRGITEEQARDELRRMRKS